MNLLHLILDAINSEPSAHPVLDLIAGKIDAFCSSEHASDGAKVQTVADQLLPLAAKYLPALGPLAADAAAVVSIFEPFLGRAVDAAESTIGAAVADSRPTQPDSGEAHPMPPVE